MKAGDKNKRSQFFFSFTFLSTSDSEKRKACSQLSRFRKGERSFFPDSFFFTFPSCLRARTPSFHFFFFWNKVNSRHTLLFYLQPGFSTSKGKRTLTTGRISVVFFFCFFSGSTITLATDSGSYQVLLCGEDLSIPDSTHTQTDKQKQKQECLRAIASALAFWVLLALLFFFLISACVSELSGCDADFHIASALEVP